MSATDNKKIAIVGGGPGGLTLARLLQLQGANVAVYERDSDRNARVTGSALDLHEDSGLAALEAAGLTEAFRANWRPDLDRLYLLDEQGSVLYEHDRRANGRIHRPEIERAPLRNLLLNSLAPETVQWNKKLERTSLQGQQVQLEFADGERVLADLVVGADGANSRFRALVTSIHPQYAGVTLVEGTVPDASTNAPHVVALLKGKAAMAMGARQTLGLGGKADGSLLFYAGLEAPPERASRELENAKTAEERVAWFRRYFPAWGHTWEPLFAAASSLTWRPQMVCPADQCWEAKPNVTLIGDAAHVMPPYAGEGVNMAMLDALVLSRQLSSSTDLHTAISAYEQEMFARMNGMLRETMGNTEAFYAPDAAAQIVGMFRGFARTAAAKPKGS